MHELITCPVCTLYLRPGMALEDHLETHPKEQVIRALVSLAVGTNRAVSSEFQPPHMASNSFNAYNNNDSSDSDGYSRSAPEPGPQYVFAPPPPRPNVMILNRQSTMVYQSSPAREQPSTQRVVAQQNFIAPSQLQIFALSHQNPTTNNRLPPPPAYGTAINQIRSQQHQSQIGIHCQPPPPRPSSSSPLPRPSSARRNSPPQRASCTQTPPLPAGNYFASSSRSSPRPPPSPSVLRYAESPISAQYVERDNGDFIVQESPRHVVECVETETGEFSVIEKVIQSPPSVVQFHECDKGYDADIKEYHECEVNCEAFEELPSTPSPKGVDSEEHENADNETVIAVIKGSGVKEVTVLSNVKLDANESLEIMENLENIKSSAQGELIWSGLADIKREVESRIENTGKNKNEATDGISEQPQIEASTSSATSVIRMAGNKPSVGRKKLDEVAIDAKATKQHPKDVRPQSSKRGFKKQPKKLTVKFKVAVPGLDNDSTEKNNNPTETDLHASTTRETETQVQTSNLVVDFKSDSAVKTKQNDDGPFEPMTANRNEMANLSERISPTALDTTDNAIDLENAVVTIPKQETDPSATEVNLDVAQPMIVHEPSQSHEPHLESSDECEWRDMIKERSSTTAMPRLQESPAQFLQATDAANQDMELEQFLHQVCSQDTHKVETLEISSSTENDALNPSVELDNKIISDDCKDDVDDFTFSCSKDIELSNMNSMYPSSSSLSTKATMSTFALQQDEAQPEEGPFQQKAQQEQPPEFNAEYPFGLFYGSANAAEDQPWARYVTQQQMSQFNELDNEQGNYMDLDTYRITNCQVSSIPNIHADEKMPAKGEISEQESNGDVENSWSNPHYAISGFRLTNTYEPYKTDWTENTDGVIPFSQDFVTEVKTDPMDEQNTDLTAATRKNELLLNRPNFTSTSEPTKKVEKSVPYSKRIKQFQCAHCMERFPLLKERNAHLIVSHGYKRVNRRLIREAPSCTITTENMATLAVTNEISTQVENNVTITNSASDEAAEDEKADIKPEITVTSTPIDASVFPRTKYDSIRAGVYRMLMHFNLNVLKSRNVAVDETYFESKSFCCFTCKRNFISVKLYDEHLAEHPAECFTCHRKFTRWTYFSLHLKRHVGWKDFACSVCEKKFVIRSALVEHMRMHTGVAPLKCNLCERTFKRYSNLTQHKKVCHSSRATKKKDYVCYCGEVLPSKARFLWHKETHDTKPKVCPYCRDRFIHRRSLKRHIRLTHSDKFDYIQPVKCEECKQVYAKASMKAHMLTHSIDTLHECSICNKSFTTKWNLKIHSWVHANRTAKPFKCEHCVKAFVREVDYKNHLNSHKNIKPFTCEYCGCKFIRKYNYIRHRKEHTAQKRFKCDLCCKMFHRNYYLIEHRRMHTGERPFLCTICGKSSTTKTNHNKHLKIHHSRDPFTAEA